VWQPIRRRRFRRCRSGATGAEINWTASTSHANPAAIRHALPEALDPLALSLNENPFPPLPAVGTALMEAIDVVNRYAEFLPSTQAILAVVRKAHRAAR
jgi:histidinol-phosphate/aromatic aminotransferase/cobyric acid decarboxylase-like protein